MSASGEGPVLRTERLLLRPVCDGDTDELHRLFVDPAVRRFLWDDVSIPRRTAVEVIAASRESFSRFGFGQWTARERGDPDVIVGFSGLRRFDEPSDPPKVELLYGLYPSHWGRGLATEAARAVLERGFESCGLERIYAGADLPNRSSFRVMERLGMRPWRRLEIDGQEADYYVLERPSRAVADRAEPAGLGVNPERGGA